jgi:hypothetical protein
MLIVLLAILAIGPLKPDPTLTPGVVRDLTVQQVCSTKWGKDRRHVTLAMRQDVFRRYGVDWAKHRLYEVDHLIPRELGGDDALENLWVQIWTGPLGAHAKDKAENAAHRAVCAGTLSLENAQAQMRAWGR